MTNPKIYNLYIPYRFPKGHRREGKQTLFSTKILNTIGSRAGWRKTFVLKHGFKGWQYKIDNIIKGYAALNLIEKNEDGSKHLFATISNLFYQKVRITYNTEKDKLEILVDGRLANEDLFLSGVGLSREDFVSLYLPKRNSKRIIKYDGIIILLSGGLTF